jgi:hypothetical protein
MVLVIVRGCLSIGNTLEIWVFVSVQWRYANSLAALGDSVFGVEKDRVDGDGDEDAVMVVAWRHRL